MRKPFFKKSRNTWYCEINRKQISLGRDKAEAEREYHRLMAGEIPVTSKTTVAQLVQDFLSWVQRNREEQTHYWYKHHCESFARYVKSMKVADVRPYHITRWLERCYANCSDTGKNGAVRAVCRVFNWAKKQGLIGSNPVSGMERPAASPREEFLSAAQYKELISLIDPADPFYDFVVFLWETGARPHEARTAHTKHFSNSQLVFDRLSSKGKKYRRVIYLDGDALEIVKRHATGGYIFRNKVGKPWAASSLVSRFKHLSEKLGYRVFPYMLRHGFCTQALLNGVDPLSVGLLMGHRDPTMVMKVYQHVAQDGEHLLAKLRQAKGSGAA